MSWQNGMQQNNSWYGTPPYANYAPYACPPGSGYPAAPFPPPGWPGYGPYAGYQFPGGWPYGVPPNMQGNFVASSDQSSDQNKQSTDVSTINPPLPPDPPPGEPPKEENKEEKKEEPKTDKKEEKKTDAEETSKDEKKDTEQKQQTNVTPAFTFDPSQFSVPPPPANCYPMYPQNPWLNSQGYPNAPFPFSPMANTSNANTNQNNNNSPIRFSINNKKGSLPSNPLQQAPLSTSDKKVQEPSNTNIYQKPPNITNVNDSNMSNKSDNQNKRKKKSKLPWENDDSNSTNSFSSNNDSNTNKTLVNSQRYVERCFARCVTELDKDQVEICLKGKLTSAARNESLWTKNWDQEPLISIHSAVAVNEKKDSSMNGRIFNSKKFEGDPSRGFTVIRGRVLDHVLLLHIHLTVDDDVTDEGTAPPNLKKNLFIGFKSRPGRGRGGQRGRGGKKKGKDRGGVDFQGAENSYFYSKSGSMTLDPDLCTDERLQKRAARFANAQRGNRGGGGGGEGGGGRGKANVNKKKRNMNLSLSINNAFVVDGENIDWTSIHIVGTSTTLEKQYLRLTSAPEPSTIRTLPTLKRALNHVKNQWKVNRDYFYTCNQMKSIRQDLTVQGIRDEFTIEVYETHCRIALEKGDHEEFNQCQTQLKELYSDRGGANRMEFVSYRLLYYIFTKNTLDITSMLASLTASEKKDPCIAFALKLRAAWSLSNYYQFFKLYRKAPQMTGYLIDWFAKRERERAIKVLTRSYRPGNLSIDYVKSTLALSGEDWGAFVDEYKLIFTADNKFIDCKKSAVNLLA
ncbi:Leukocyte receptor cluster member 8-like protein [Armadillidium vulgare]|nr:Leukocyte receptor cluster member 8-like protein [Armadillidium vulgare]